MITTNIFFTVFLTFSKVESEVQTRLKELFSKENYEVHRFEEEAGFSIVKMGKAKEEENKKKEEEGKEKESEEKGEAEEKEQQQLPLAVNVTLTSNKVREAYEKRLKNEVKKSQLISRVFEFQGVS